MDAVGSAHSLSAALQPMLLIVAALLSTVVLIDARRRDSPLCYAVPWTLATLFYPYVVFPLYWAVRLLKRRPAPPKKKLKRTLLLRVIAPAAAYFLLIVLIGMFLHERDEDSFDAHLERAAEARLRERHGEAAQAYREALALADDAHTHKLLGVELMAQRQWGAALEHFRAAEKGGDEDELLNFYLANTLEQLNRGEEALAYHSKFSASSRCAAPLPDARCRASK